MQPIYFKWNEKYIIGELLAVIENFEERHYLTVRKQRARIESSAANDVMSISCHILSQCSLAIVVTPERPHILFWLVLFVPLPCMNKGAKRCCRCKITAAEFPLRHV